MIFHHQEPQKAHINLLALQPPRTKEPPADSVYSMCDEAKAIPDATGLPSNNDHSVLTVADVTFNHQEQSAGQQSLANGKITQNNGTVPVPWVCPYLA